MLKITKNQGSIQVTADKSGFYPFDGTITFPTNSLFTATSANTDMITFKSTSNGDVQFVGNYKDITISGLSFDTKQKFLTAFSNLANQGSVDAYTKAETDAKLNDKLTAQTNANGALFISSSSNDDATDSVALYHSTVKGSRDVAIQLASTPNKEGVHNLAILSLAEANGSGNIAIGVSKRCKGTSNIGIGVGVGAVTGDLNTVDVNGNGNVCIGASSQAHTDNNNAVENSIAIGSDAKTSSNFCTVIGNRANSKSSHAVAVGDNAYVYRDCDSSVAVGDSARAYGKNSVAIGCTSYAHNDKPLDICCGKKDNNEVLSVLQSDATGKISVLKGDGTDERMVIQDEIEALKNAGGSGGTVDAYTKAETDTKLDAKQDKLTAGSGITITKDETAGTSTIATAVSLTDNGNGAYTVGDSIKIGSNTVAIGASSSASGDYSITIGYDTINDGLNSVLIGYLSRAGNGDDDGSVIIGAAANGASGTTSTLIGYCASSSGFACTGIGPTARVDDTTPLVIKAGHKTVNDEEQVLTMIQGDANGKISLLKGDGTLERIVIQDEIEALKNAGGSGGTVDAYTKAETDTKLEAKQDKLTAGSGITIDENNVISSTGGSGGTVDAYTKTETDALLNTKQNTLTAGSGITIDENNVISSTGGSGGGANPLVNVKGTNGNATIDDNVTDGIAIGSGATSTRANSIVIGGNASAAGSHCTVIGDGASATNPSCTVIGDGAHSFSYYGVAVGNRASIDTSSHNCIAVGYGVNARGENSVAIGKSSKATKDNPLVINAGSMIVDGIKKTLTVLQSDATGKLSILKGDGTLERIVIQDEITALKAEITTLKAEIAALKGGA